MNTLAETLGGNREPWMTHPGRNCATSPNAHRELVQVFADLWHPHGNADARRLCKGCPVQTACLAYAVARPELEGIWGGCTERQRAELRKGRRA